MLHWVNVAVCSDIKPKHTNRVWAEFTIFECQACWCIKINAWNSTFPRTIQLIYPSSRGMPWYLKSCCIFVPHIALYFRAAYCAIFLCRKLSCISVPQIVLYFHAAYCVISVPHKMLYFRAAYCVLFRAANCAVFPCRILCCISVSHIVLYFRAAYCVYFRAANCAVFPCRIFLSRK